MPPHDLYGNAHHHQIPQLIYRLKIQKQNPVHPNLTHVHKLRCAQMLSHQHTEHRRRLWIFQRHVGKMNPGTVG